MSRVASRQKVFRSLLAAFMLLSLVVSPALAASPVQAPEDTVNITVLHYNDFHGNLELAGSNPGIARMAKVINDVRVVRRRRKRRLGPIRRHDARLPALEPVQGQAHHRPFELHRHPGHDVRQP